MKIYKILSFIIACTAAVATLAFIFPENGISIGNFNIRYANADKFIYPPKAKVINIHKSSQAIADANKIRLFIASKEENKFIAKQIEFIAHPFAINFPNDDIKWIDTVFFALEQAKNKKVRILHYGDSQIEEDRMSSTIRHRFQSVFGGFGVGLLPPLQTIPSSAISQRSYGNHSRFVVYGTKNMHHPDNLYGPIGQMLTTVDNYSTSFLPINLNATKNNTKRFQNVSVLVGNNSSPIKISIDANEYTDSIVITDSLSHLHIASFSMPYATDKATINVKGKSNLYGYILDGNNNGLQVDNIPMRGCSGSVFTRMAESSLCPFVNKYSIPLIILQYGGNSVPYLKSSKSITNYCKSIEYQIKYLKKISPNSKFLFIGPSDMSTSIEGSMQTYPALPEIVDRLRNTCLENDVAYWDLFSAMGGLNSMITWVNSSPALAGADHVHFTTLGSQTAASMLCDYILELYSYYQERFSPFSEADSVTEKSNEPTIKSEISNNTTTDSIYIEQ